MGSSDGGIWLEGADRDSVLVVIDQALDVLINGLEGDDGPALGQRLRIIEHVHRRLEACTATVIGEARRSGAWSDDGHRCSAAWVETETGEPRATATAQVRVADLAGHAPQVLDQLRSGRLGSGSPKPASSAASTPTRVSTATSTTTPSTGSSTRPPPSPTGCSST